MGEVIFFMILMVSSIWYRETWEKYANRKSKHLVIGSISAGAATISALIINAAQAFMLTPGKYFETQNLFDAVFNPTMLPSSLHLLIPCILNAAAVLGIYAYIQRKRKATEQTYYDTVGAFTARITTWGILLQPLAGLYYLWTVYGANHTAFQNIIFGLSAPFFWTMVALGSITFILSILYLNFGWERGKTIFLIAAVLVLFVFPFGAYNRERARKPFLIYGRMYMTQKPVIPPPILEPQNQKSEIQNQKSGTDIIQEHNCNICHTIQGKGGSVGPELKGLNKKFNGDKEKLKKFLRSPPTAMPPFDGSSADLDILIEYLMKLQ
jgi:cytochrome bd-type quinol oxidase subunit 1